MKRLLFFAAGAAALASCTQQPAEVAESEIIRMNQWAFYEYQPKCAVVLVSDTTADLGDVQIINKSTGQVVYTAQAGPAYRSEWSKQWARRVRFDDLTATDFYTLKVGADQRDFVISHDALRGVAAGALHAFYLQRTGEEILPEYAGEYARPAAHPDTVVLVHPSAATQERPEGTVLSSPGGWYDAGDFNKYIVNSAFAVAVMMRSYMMEPEYYKTLDSSIPESKNEVPDILEELMVNLKWMLTMQDTDGGLYHKLTTPSFEGFIMPADARQTRYVVQKSTAASLDFAASMAMAVRCYEGYPQYADFCAQAKAAAIRAFDWAVKNPAVLYDQPGFNQTCKPEVSTGMYDDTELRDEWFWASTEMYKLTGEKRYFTLSQDYAPSDFQRANWKDISGMGVYTWLLDIKPAETEQGRMYYDQFYGQFTQGLDHQLAEAETSPYGAPYGVSAGDFFWGCNSEGCAENGIEMLIAYKLTGDTRYLDGAVADADYLLGRNATGYSYVTGFGKKTPMHPHQRLSAADGIEAPLPGFLVGGPNPGQQDGAFLQYNSSLPDESYMDHEGSYASNEIAINWNATLVALMGGLDAVANNQR